MFPQVMRRSTGYYDLAKIQGIAVQRIQDPETTSADVARLMLSVEKIERLKREIRGIPPLAPVALRELPMKRARKGLPAPEPIEIEPEECV